jgi:hypothetical protein
MDEHGFLLVSNKVLSYALSGLFVLVTKKKYYRKFANFEIFLIGIICEFVVKIYYPTFQTLSLRNQIFGLLIHSV